MDGLPKVSKHLIWLYLSTVPVQNLIVCVPSPPQSSPNNMGGMNNPPGTPRDDSEMGGNFLNPFQSESVSRASESHLTPP